MGDGAFKRFSQSQANNLGAEVDKSGLKQVVAVPVIINAVAAYFQVDAKEICNTKRGVGAKNLPRWIAMKLCQEAGGETLVNIAAHFHVNHYSTVSKTIQRLNQLMEEDPKVARNLNRLSQDLSP